MNSLMLDEDESFSMSANISSPGYQSVVLRGYLVKRIGNGTYVAPLIPQLFYGADGLPLTTWRQNLSTAGSQVILSRGAGGYPQVQDECLFWRKISDGMAGQPRTDAERAERHLERYGTTELPPRGTGYGLQAPSLQIPSWVVPVAIGVGAIAVIGYFLWKR